MKKSLKALLLACVLFAGVQLSAQVTDLTTGRYYIGNTALLLPYHQFDDDWQVKLPPCSSPFPCPYGTGYIPVPCGSGVFANYLCDTNLVSGGWINPNARFLSIHMYQCVSLPSSEAYITGAHDAMAQTNGYAGTYHYRRKFNNTTCSPQSAVLNIDHIGTEDFCDTILINGNPYLVTFYAATIGQSAVIPINVAHLNPPGVDNYIEFVTHDSNTHEGFMMEGNITISGGTNIDPAFSLSFSGNNLIASSSSGGTHYWDIYGSTTGMPGSYALISTASGNPIYIPDTLKCYYVEHKVVGNCGSMCAAQSICNSDCDTGPNPCDLTGRSGKHTDGKLEWDQVPGAAYYLIQVVPDHPACCPDPVSPLVTYELIKYGTIHPLDWVNDFGLNSNEERCFAWRVIPVCPDGTRGIPSGWLCSSDGSARSTGLTAPDHEAVAVSMFPNPAKTQVSIEIGTVAGTDVNVTISDLTGRTVKTFRNVKTASKTSTLTWNTEAMAKGTYLVKIETADHHVISKKLIID